MDGENMPDGGWNLMKWGVSKFLLRRRFILAVAVAAFGLIMPAYSQTQDVVLLLEQSPVKGGETTPAAGVHHFKAGSEVFLKAVPKPGYKFVHWLGEVSDPAASSTIAYLDKHKVVVAVFEQAEDAVSAAEGGISGGGGGGGSGLFPTALDLSRPGGFSGGGGGSNVKPQSIVYDVKGKKPAPEVPEPATGLLLMLGSLFALKRSSRKKGCRARSCGLD
jgi:uncharacterized membrane protein YgcG